MENEVSDNGRAGVEVRGEAQPTMRRNRLLDGRGAGLLVAEGARAIVEDNEIAGNAGAGVEIADGADPTLRRNRIVDGLVEANEVLDAYLGTS